ncbi:MAG: glycoside hydrolase family 97 catalytic domain-containing protein, partial [Calditrichaeota bacterium]|nr:glycoside hydrolase family 97 catalytic domain-containing protein [Calditrichota bacterium]
MPASILVLGLLLAACAAHLPKSNGAGADRPLSLASPDGQNVLDIELAEGRPYYRLTRSGQGVIDRSAMGFVFKENSLGAMVLSSSQTGSVDQTWRQVWGEKAEIRNHYNQLTIALQEKEAPFRRLTIEFRAYDDGIAFRYSYPQQGESGLVIMDELTEFNLSRDGQAWWIGAYQDNRYEYLTNKTAISALDTAITPLTLQTEDGLYLSFHEARLVDFASMTVARTAGTRLKADLVPWADGDRVKTDGSFTSPWRTVQIAQKPGDLITSYLILNLNDDNKLKDTSWIKPHKYLGIWWGMHIGKYTFWESPTQGATTENAIAYIDYCTRFGIDHLLIEGWNKGWTPAWYENAMHMFNFTREADGFDLQAVVEYARQKGVSIIGYHETGANIINYRKQIDAGMALYHSLGIHDIKIGQVGSRLNMTEWHHGQFGVRYYREVLEKAAQYQLAVNFHEPIKDTGERRTYPNMMSREGARGQEYNAWSEGNPPSHT